MSHLNPSISNATVVFSWLLGLLAFDEAPGWLASAGVALVVLGAVVLSSQAPRAAATPPNAAH